MPAPKDTDTQLPASHVHAAVTGKHRTALEAIFRHPTPHNLEWHDVIGLMGSIGMIQEKANGDVEFKLAGALHRLHKPHTKNLAVEEVIKLRHFLQQAGWSPDGKHPKAGQPAPSAPNLMLVVDHHGAKIYRVEVASTDPLEHQIKPYDPHHFLHHLTHKGQSREAGQRAPEDPGFYEQVAQALAAANKIAVVGHGTGKSNEAQQLLDHLRSHHYEIYAHIAREIVTDLSSVTPAQLLHIARQALA
jgi:hypothetical protein